MSWDELAMVNLQSKGDGSWSYTAYMRPFALWRSNKGLPDVFACIEDIMKEIAMADDLEQSAAVAAVLMRSEAADAAHAAEVTAEVQLRRKSAREAGQRVGASGGISGKPAKVKGKAKR